MLWQKTNQKPHCVYFNHWADEQTQQDADTMHRSRKVIFFSSQTCVERMGERCKYCHQVYFYQFFFFLMAHGHGWTEVEMDQLAVEDLCSVDGWYKYCQNTLSEHCTPFSRISNKQKNYVLNYICFQLLYHSHPPQYHCHG